MAAAVPTSAQPTLRAAPMNLFPVMGSLQDVVDYATSKLPVTDENEMKAILFTYHNTLLATQAG
jgi:hypothetical protein